MKVVNFCPHCGGEAMTLKDKLLTGPIAGAQCRNCTKPVGISLTSMWPLFFMVIPAFFLGGKAPILDFLLTVMGLGAIVWWISQLPLEPR